MKRHFDILASKGFLVGLLVLFVNDTFLKYEFSNFITGKLSDFAGLFIFPLFIYSFFPKRKIPIYIITCIGFILWKSPVSDSFIYYWNSFSFYQIGRVVDYTDLFALLILPFSYIYKPKSININRILLLPVGIFTFIVFCATAGTHGNINLYSLDTSKKNVKEAIDNFYDKNPKYRLPNELIELKIHYEFESEKLTKNSSMNADSINFEFYVQKKDNMVIWIGFVGNEKNWTKPNCELGLLGYIILGENSKLDDGEKWKYNDDLSSDEIKEIKSFYELEILNKIREEIALISQNN